jgi:hypothetical protein
VFESLTEAQWVGFSFVLLGMALICGMLVRRAVPWLAAVYIPTSVLAGLLIVTALSVPIILSIGSLTFGIASAAATAGLITWGVVRNRRP